ncbi:M15 family peptidase [bacterium]|nr:MAG: M15 family peptidase [bacterium]
MAKTKIPNGRAAVEALYGNPRGTDGKASATWERANLVVIDLPFAMRASWDLNGKPITRVQIHKLAADDLRAIFTAIWTHARLEVKRRHGFDTKTSAEYDALSLQWLRDHNLDILGGTYNFRQIRGGSGLSMHSYGIAVDIDPEHNALGDTSPAMPKWVVEIFEAKGWLWGGKFAGRKDGQHFQRATGV